MRFLAKVAAEGTVRDRMFERFTDQARRVVVLAQEEARLLNHDYIGTEHLLLGLLHEDSGLALQALAGLGVSLEAVRAQVLATTGAGERAPSTHIPFSPRAKKVLELALREAMRLGTDYIGTEHLMLGMIREGEGVAAQVLTKLGRSLEEVRRSVLALYEQQPPEEREERGQVQGEPGRERGQTSLFEPRFPMPGFLQRRNLPRGSGAARATRAYAEYLPAAAPRTPARAEDPVVRRPEETERLLAVLARRERNNALLVGPSGCGKSALVRGLFQTLAEQRGPAALGSGQLMEFDLAVLRIGVDRIVRRGFSPVVLVEDLDLLLRADELSDGRLVTGLAALTDAESPLILTATAEAARRLGQGFPTLAARFEVLELPEAGESHARAVLELLRPGMQEHHRLAIEDSALAAAIELAPRLHGGRALPGGAVDLLDAAAARTAVAHGTVVGEQQVRAAA